MRNFGWCLCLLITASCCAQENSSWKELIILMPKSDNKSIYKINKQLACMQGLHFSGYYAPASCLLLKYDSTKIVDPNIISTIIHHLNHKLNIHIVRGIKIYDVVDGKMDAMMEEEK